MENKTDYKPGDVVEVFDVSNYRQGRIVKRSVTVTDVYTDSEMVLVKTPLGRVEILNGSQFIVDKDKAKEWVLTYAAQDVQIANMVLARRQKIYDKLVRDFINV